MNGVYWDSKKIISSLAYYAKTLVFCCVFLGLGCLFFLKQIAKFSSRQCHSYCRNLLWEHKERTHQKKIIKLLHIQSFMTTAALKHRGECWWWCLPCWCIVRMSTTFMQTYLSKVRQRGQWLGVKQKNCLFWLVWCFLELLRVAIKWNMKTGEGKWTSWDRQALTFCSEAHL